MNKIGVWINMSWFEIFITIITIAFCGLAIFIMVGETKAPKLTPEQQYLQDNPYDYVDTLGNKGVASNCDENDGSFMSGGGVMTCELSDGTTIQVYQFKLSRTGW